MGTIEEIIKAIDDELIKSEKEYLTLVNANKILLNQNLISIPEKLEKTLKKILEDKKIPHAYQTESTPKHWRIPLSEKGQTIKTKSKNTSTLTNKNKAQNKKSYSYNNLKVAICPNCSNATHVPYGQFRYEYINCINCKLNFPNPYYQIKPDNTPNTILHHNKKHNQTDSSITKTQRNWIISIAVLIVLFIIVSYSNNYWKDRNNSDNYSFDDSNKELYQNTPSETSNTIDLNNFTGQKITFKSTENDNESNGEIIQTNHEITYHTFDFINLNVTQKSPLNGQWVTITYPMKGFYKEKGIAATTYVITVNQLGVKEIWFSPDVPNLGYDYEDGTRISCYNVTKVK